MDSDSSPQDPGPPGPPTASEPPRRSRLPLFLAVAAGAIVIGFLVFRWAPGSRSAAGSAVPPAAPPALIAGSPVLLSTKAVLVADRYQCLCGDCSDTLGRCTCSHEKGSNEMKATLNRLAEEKKSVADIDAAMVEKYGAKVLASGPSRP